MPADQPIEPVDEVELLVGEEMYCTCPGVIADVKVAATQTLPVAQVAEVIGEQIL